MNSATLVSQVGFPIAAFLLMFRFARTTVQDNTDALRELAKEVRANRREADARRRMYRGEQADAEPAD